MTSINSKSFSWSRSKFDDGYIDNYTYALPILEEFGLQGSFFIPGKTFMTHQLLDVNKIHYILASAEVHSLIRNIFERLDYYRGTEFEYPSNEELFNEHAIANRFDCKQVSFAPPPHKKFKNLLHR